MTGPEDGLPWEPVLPRARTSNDGYVTVTRRCSKALVGARQPRREVDRAG